VYVDRRRNEALVSKFLDDEPSSPKANSTGPLPVEEFLASILPDDTRVRIRNVDVRYVDYAWSVSFKVRKGNALFAKSGITFDIDGASRLEHDSLSGSGPFSSLISLSGEVASGFSAGQASLSLSELSGNGFSVRQLGLVTTWKDGMLRAETVQDLQPVDISVEWDSRSGALQAELACDRLLPLYWITPSRTLPRALKEVTLTGSARAEINAAGALSYEADLRSSFPDSFYGGGIGALRLDGDRDALFLRELSLRGPRFDMEGTGSYTIVSNIPEGVLTVSRCEPVDSFSLSGELFFQRSGNGFLAIVPELSCNGASFSSIQLAAYPDRVEGYDVSLEARDSRGKIGLESTLVLGEAPFVQGYLSVDSIDAVNLIGLVGNPGDRAAPSSWGLTTEVYFSSNLENLSFNCTRLVLASSSSSGDYVLLSAKGNERDFEIIDISSSPSLGSLSGSIHASIDDGSDVLFEADLSVAAIPYRFSGMYAGGSLSAYGDYGLAISIVPDRVEGISGSVRMDEFPLPVGQALFALSLDAGFAFASETQWNAAVRSGFIKELNGAAPLSTTVAFAGTADPGGVFLPFLEVADAHSTLMGSLRASFDVSQQGLSSISADMELASPDRLELIAAQARFTVSEQLYLEGNAQIESLPLMRFMRAQTEENELTASLTFSGTPDSLFASAEVSSLSWRVGGHDLSARAMILVEDGSIVLSNTVASWNGQSIGPATGTFNLVSGEARIDAAYSGLVNDEPCSAGFVATLVPDPTASQGTSSDGAVPGSLGDRLERFTLAVTARDIVWGQVRPAAPFTATLVHEPGINALYAGPDDMITGFLLDDGTFSLKMSEASPVSLTADGSVEGDQIAVIASQIRVDMARLWPLVAIDVVSFHSGIVTGELAVSGLLSDPDFFGTLKAEGVVVSSPDFVEERYVPDPFEIVAEGKTLTVEEFSLRSPSSSLRASAQAFFDRWAPTRVNLLVKTGEGRPVLVDTVNPYFAAKGQALCDLDLSFSYEAISVRGNVEFDRGAFAIIFSGFMEESTDTGAPVIVDLSLVAGKRVEFRWPSNDLPILRGLIQAEQPFRVRLDSSSDTFGLEGSANLKGGELFYIKRSFYLRQGSIVFKENQDKFDPLISLRAEIRERDEYGDPVRIILLVENQPLASFTPVVFSDPPKSNAELMALLGQAASADSSRDTLLRNTVITASDIFTQMGLFRGVENTVRDALNLDIFSIRTLLLQNALFGQSMQKEGTESQMTVGNYFDNTTVYFGKYFGSSVYADALLHFSYFDPKSAQNAESKEAIYGNLLFEPELGIEIDTPFFLVRWGFSPNNLDSYFVGDNSITLTWKFSY
jgi:hypothetical protein